MNKILRQIFEKNFIRVSDRLEFTKIAKEWLEQKRQALGIQLEEFDIANMGKQQKGSQAQINLIDELLENLKYE